MTFSFAVAGNGASVFHAQVKQMFFEICDVERNHQRTRLMELCGDQPKLLREVRRLLEHDVDEALFDLENGLDFAARPERR